MRTHVVIDDEVMREVDRIVGPRRRSEFIEQALREKLQHERQDWAVEALAGALKGGTPEYWSTPDRVVEWIRERRRLDQARIEAKLQEQRRE
ncbi:MAG TPA: type II toxin-antitoxin system VapB family antitoxin [Chloroflexota bacterium]|jgi:Arc/MetJ family transcription regulator